MSKYIEQDAVLDAVLNLPAKMDEDGYGWLGRRGVWQMLLDFPTVEAEPVRNGKWERHYKRPDVLADLWWYCSACGEKQGDQYADHYKYCPNCGAKMDKGETP